MNWMPGRRQSTALHVHFLGLTAVDAAIQLQEELVNEIASRTDTYGVILLCEHPFGFSVGREGTGEDLRIDRDEFALRGVAVRWQSRGGRTWVNHPGQLVAYAILPLTRLSLSAPRWCDVLTDAAIATAAELAVPVEACSNPVGAGGRCGQFAFVGTAIRQGVSLFGGCLNVAIPRPTLFLADWGPGVRPTTLATERMRPTAMSAVRECWIRHLAAEAGYDRYHVWTGHPRLRRTHQPGYVFAPT